MDPLQPRSSITGQYQSKVDSEGHVRLLSELMANPEEALEKLVDRMIESSIAQMLPGVNPILKAFSGQDPHGKTARGRDSLTPGKQVI